MATQSGRDVHLENVTGEQRQSRALLDSRADVGKAAVLDSDKTVKTGGAACADLHGVVSARGDRGCGARKTTRPTRNSACQVQRGVPHTPVHGSRIARHTGRQRSRSEGACAQARGECMMSMKMGRARYNRVKDNTKTFDINGGEARGAVIDTRL